MARKRSMRIRRVEGLNKADLGIQLDEHVRQRFLNERMIVYDENLHLSPLDREDVHANVRALVRSL